MNKFVRHDCSTSRTNRYFCLTDAEICYLWRDLLLSQSWHVHHEPQGKCTDVSVLKSGSTRRMAGHTLPCGFDFERFRRHKRNGDRWEYLFAY